MKEHELNKHFPNEVHKKMFHVFSPQRNENTELH